MELACAAELELGLPKPSAEEEKASTESLEAAVGGLAVEQRDALRRVSATNGALHVGAGSGEARAKREREADARGLRSSSIYPPFSSHCVRGSFSAARTCCVHGNSAWCALPSAIVPSIHLQSLRVQCGRRIEFLSAAFHCSFFALTLLPGQRCACVTFLSLARSLLLSRS